MFSRFRQLSLLILFLVIASLLNARDVRVDRDELAGAAESGITFTNYVGPYEFTNTVDEIRSIGRGLASALTPGEPGEAQAGNKYRVIRIVSPDIADGLDADIFILDANAAVDHIDNLRAILAGYFETAYGFSTRDAFLIAEFTTYYNAVYRGDSAMVAQRYKAPVAQALEPGKIGLDTHYANWPGETQMLIPLRGALAGGGGTEAVVDTVAISDDEVIDLIREEEDQGIDSRRDMVELREAELDQEQAALDEQAQDVQDRREAVEEELQVLEGKEDAGEELTPAEEGRREELVEKAAVVEEEAQAVEEAQEQLDERTQDVLEMRDEIARDENTRLEAESEPAAQPAERSEGGGGPGTSETSAPVPAAESETPAASSATEAEPTMTPVWFLTVDAEGNGIPFGRVVRHDLQTGRLLNASETTSVRGRGMEVLPDAVIVITGKSGENSRVRLARLNPETLATESEGADDIFPGSLLTVNGDHLYLITAVEGQWRLGRFNTGLERQAVSKVVLEPFTSISFDGSSLYVQAENGQILKLSAATLKEEVRLE